MQAWELAGLVEAAGPDYVGVNIDPGNATWTLEDPVASLETLAPYVACTSIRDSAVWETPTGVVVEWVAMGDGDVDFKRWADLFAEKVKNVPVFLETFAGLRRPFNYLSDPAFFKLAEDAGAGSGALPRRRQARQAARGAARVAAGRRARRRRRGAAEGHLRAQRGLLPQRPRLRSGPSRNADGATPGGGGSRPVFFTGKALTFCGR